MKRNFIFAFLLAIFLLQGTVAAIGIDASLFRTQNSDAVTASAAQGDGTLGMADVSTVSSTIEELSDYALPAQPDPSTLTRSARSAGASLVFLSVIPLTAKPPPRA